MELRSTVDMTFQKFKKMDIIPVKKLLRFIIVVQYRIPYAKLN